MSEDDPEFLPPIAVFELAEQVAAEFIGAGTDVVFERRAGVAVPADVHRGVAAVRRWPLPRQRVLPHHLHPLFTTTCTQPKKSGQESEQLQAHKIAHYGTMLSLEKTDKNC